MNEGTKKGDAKGITIDSLMKLIHIKSNCKSLTLLDFIAESLNHDGNDALHFCEELPDLVQAARLSLNELQSQIEILKTGVIAAEEELSELEAEMASHVSASSFPSRQDDTGVSVSSSASVQEHARESTRFEVLHLATQNLQGFLIESHSSLKGLEVAMNDAKLKEVAMRIYFGDHRLDSVQLFALLKEFSTQILHAGAMIKLRQSKNMSAGAPNEFA